MDTAVQDQWLKWKIRGEGTVYQLWAKMGPKQVVRTLFMKVEVWERWISITGGAGTAFLAFMKVEVWERWISITGGAGTAFLAFMKVEVWERWISITGGAGTAFPCFQ